MELIERELKYKGNTETVYFLELTAGQRVSLLRGQKIQSSPGEKSSVFEIDLGENTEKTHKLIQMTLVDADGKRVYKNLQELQNEPDSKVRALAKLAADVHKDDDDAGNA